MYLSAYLWNNNEIFSATQICSLDFVPDPVYNEEFFEDLTFCQMTLSCENNCGKVNKYNDLITNQRCFCDKLCLIFDDCCSDFVEFCPEESALGNNILDTKFSGLVNSSYIHSINSLLDNFEYKVVSFCPSDPTACGPPPIYFERTINDAHHSAQALQAAGGGRERREGTRWHVDFLRTQRQ